MSNRILVCGTTGQIRILSRYPHLITGLSEEKIDYCTSTNTLLLNISGYDPKRNIATKGFFRKEYNPDTRTWDLPKKIYFTEQLRQYMESTGVGMTVGSPGFLEKLVEDLGIDKSVELIKINID